MTQLQTLCSFFTASSYGEAIQAISGKNFSQSEDVAVGAISQFAFPPLARGDPSSVLLCKSFEHVQQTNVPFHKSFERRVLYSQSVSWNLFIFSEESHNQVKVLKLKIALTHTPLRTSIEIAW